MQYSHGSQPGILAGQFRGTRQVISNGEDRHSTQVPVSKNSYVKNAGYNLSKWVSKGYTRGQGAYDNW